MQANPSEQLPRRHRRPKRLRAAPKPDLTIEQILVWIDVFYAKFGKWPRAKSGRIEGTLDVTWSAINDNLCYGRRGLPRGTSLSQLLVEHRGHRNKKRLLPLSLEMILAWADAFHARIGEWPTRNSGPIPEAATETWARVDAALTKGLRGWPYSTSLAQLLAKHRGARNRKDLPRLRVGMILHWAGLHFERTNEWPREKSGAVADAPGETWAGINAALREGLRGLPGGSSLYLLLVRHRRMPPTYVTSGTTRADRRSIAAIHFDNRPRQPVEAAGPTTGIGLNPAFVRKM